MRYHDDIIAVFKSRPPLRFFAHSFRNKRCAVFKYTCAGVYSTAQQGSFTFLDLEIHVVHPQLKIGVSQCKPLVPLSPCSAHHLIVHTSWPKVVANRTYIFSGRDPSQLAILSERLRNLMHVRTTSQSPSLNTGDQKTECLVVLLSQMKECWRL